MAYIKVSKNQKQLPVVEGMSKLVNILSVHLWVFQEASFCYSFNEVWAPQVLLLEFLPFLRKILLLCSASAVLRYNFSLLPLQQRCEIFVPFWNSSVFDINES